LIDELIESLKRQIQALKLSTSISPMTISVSKLPHLYLQVQDQMWVNLFYGWLPTYIDAGFLQPLPEEYFPVEKIEDEFCSMVEAVKMDGKYWALPTAVRSLALFYKHRSL